MNAELLHAVADALHTDLKATDALKRLTDLRDSLKGQVDQPQQPEHQQRTSERLAELQTALAQSAVNEFSPSWMQRVEELGVAHLFGDQLRQALSEIFQRNQITVATALEEVDALRQQMDQARESLVFLIDGFSGLGIGKLELEPGEFEIGVTVPRTAVDSELGELAKEFALLNKILLPFSELATGTRPPFPVRSISSSDFGVLLETLGPTAAAIAFAVERLTTWYKRLLEIRVLRQGLAEQGLSDAQLENVDAHADSHMEKGIDATIQELFEEFGTALSAERRNELEVELRQSLNAIANRIDSGYQVDVRGGPVEPADEAEDQEDPNTPYVELINDLRPGMQFMKLDGKPLLSLPEPTEDPEQSDDEDLDEGA